MGFWAAAGFLALFVHVRAPALLYLLSFLLGLATDVVWCNIYMYLAEAFPSSVRSTAFGLAMGLGRGGGVVGSALGGALSDMQVAFLLYAASLGCGGVLATLFTVETRRRTLADFVA